MTDAPNRDPEQDQRDAAVLSKHLHPGYSGDFHGKLSNEDHGATTESEPESSLRLLGGDIHRDLYRIEARSKRAKRHHRAATFSYSYKTSESSEEDGHVVDPRDAGGFRRHYLQRRHRRFHSVTTPVTRNFVSFLNLYGSFAGEDLAESDDESALESEDEERAERPGEMSPLLGRRRSSRVRPQGDASVLKSFFTLLKAFIGTGIMFLPKAFKNGGILFSSITLVTVSLVSCLCFRLLLQCRARYGGGYGDLGETIGGPRLRSLILASIAISQIGFVCAGIIFTAENLYSFLDAVTGYHPTALSTSALIVLQLIALIPLALIRNISKLGPVALLADVCILLGLTYIYYYDISSIAVHGGLNKTIELFNPRDFTLTVGSAIFTFEGIGLILPIQSSMKEPQKFDRLLYIVMSIITVIFTSVGALCYGTFGSRTSTEVISNFPQSSRLVNAVQFLYSLAVLVGTPVQLFPALRIMEGKLFGHLSGKRDSLAKWKKNTFRAGVIIVCGFIAAVGASDLDKFVALIGSFACVPLVYIYPALLHYKAVASSRLVRFGDLLMIAVGFAAMVYTTSITILRWTQN
ncbi:hypothetical protein K432DRAFT_403454 [Lepidopterella palustris CBS 459.81]|uniref:Amino acid transporter transmembrane domain-containing protein n=1 Tax=Lepidopterella palustris CBS 459.81 TaxID=1314670 RepID=A0A8E2ED44_9PEZI|nr:hypothetical protein K432DRAFT_403454 [Lepidopterella palustris CBS 459.81]